MENKWLFPLLLSSAIFICILAASSKTNFVSSISSINSLFFLPYRTATTQTSSSVFAEAKISPAPTPSGPNIPRFAYLISGSKGDLESLWRTLFALYHPRNQYVVHLDLESPLEERLELASRIEKQPLFAKVGNVFMIKKANLVTYRGPTMLATTLHAMAILLRTCQWDWFINLSASDYPLMPQDGQFSDTHYSLFPTLLILLFLRICVDCWNLANVAALEIHILML